MERSKIDKFINVHDKTLDEILDEVFSYLISVIGKWIDDYNQKIIMNRQYNQDMPYDGRKNKS